MKNEGFVINSVLNSVHSELDDRMKLLKKERRKSHFMTLANFFSRNNKPQTTAMLPIMYCLFNDAVSS
jgi:hypothetical protein